MAKTKRYKPKGKLGTGSRFKQLTRHLKRRKGKKKVTNPKALAAWIGRRKYGRKRMAWLSKAGRRRAAAKRKLAAAKRRKS